MDIYGFEVRGRKSNKVPNKKEISHKVAVVNAWREISESIPWVDMKQSQTLSPRKKKNTTEVGNRNNSSWA